MELHIPKHWIPVLVVITLWLVTFIGGICWIWYRERNDYYEPTQEYELNLTIKSNGSSYELIIPTLVINYSKYGWKEGEKEIIYDVLSRATINGNIDSSYTKTAYGQGLMLNGTGNASMNFHIKKHDESDEGFYEPQFMFLSLESNKPEHIHSLYPPHWIYYDSPNNNSILIELNVNTYWWFSGTATGNNDYFISIELNNTGWQEIELKCHYSQS